MKNIIIGMMAFGMLLGQSFVVRASSLNTTATGPGLSCSNPNSFSAHADPLTCTNHYEISGYCTQGAEGPGGNPDAVIAAGRAIYTVTSDWNGYAQTFTQHFSLSGGYKNSMGDRDKDKGTVVSHCSDDPMLNKVSCKTDPIVWTVSGTSTYHNPGLRGLFPITTDSIGISPAAVRKQLLGHSTGPQITAPKVYQKFKSHNILIVFKAALPCGMGSSAKTASLMIQKEKDIPSATPQFDTVTWVNSPPRSVKIINNGGLTKFTDLSSGTWRVRVQVISPAKGPASEWRQFTILGPTGVSTIHHGAGAVTGKVQSKPHIGQQFGQQSNQKSSQHAAVRFGGKVLNRTAPQTSLPAVQQHAMSHNNVRIGSKRNTNIALNHQAPPMQTMSGHLNPSAAPRQHARAESFKAHRNIVVPPRLKILNSSESVDASCANLGKFITLRATVINQGGPLAAGHARIFVKERGGAHIYSQSMPVPAIRHGGRTVVTLKAGTRSAYRRNIPGRHVLAVNLVVNGKTTTTRMTRAFRSGFCQVHHVEVPHRMGRKLNIKLNPQPEPPSRR